MNKQTTPLSSVISMAPILPAVGIVVALIAALTVRHQNMQQRSSETTTTNDGDNENPTTSITNALQLARQIEPPAISLSQGGEYEHGEFWGEKDPVLKAAWKEWWKDTAQDKLPDLTAAFPDMMDPALQQAVQRVRQDPTVANEALLQELLQPILPDQVYQTPFLTPQGVQLLRQHLDAASYYYTDRKKEQTNATTLLSSEVAAGIPTRRPNGMNRYGIIIDPNIEGAVSYDNLNAFVQQVVDDFVRPLSRMLFPQLTSRNHPEDDQEAYAFTIRYHPDEDVELKEHSDASVYTININLNLPETQQDDTASTIEQYEGSSLYFLDPTDAGTEESSQPQKTHVSFSPGMAVLHRGLIKHAALPITEGERHNLVIWLFGQGGYVRFAEYPKLERLTVSERWK